MNKDEELELILATAIFIIGAIILFLIGWNPIGFLAFGFILLASCLLFLMKADTQIGRVIMVIFWISSIASLVKGVLDLTQNSLSGAIVAIIVFFIVLIIIYRRSK